LPPAKKSGIFLFPLVAKELFSYLPSKGIQHPEKKTTSSRAEQKKIPAAASSGGREYDLYGNKQYHGSRIASSRDLISG
jgi:hypothetical protein